MFISHDNYYSVYDSIHEPKGIEHWDEKQRSWQAYENQKGQGWSKRVAKRKKQNKVAKATRKRNRRH